MASVEPLILATVNASYSRKLSGEQVASLILDLERMKAMPGHAASFFYEVDPDLQRQFAGEHGISDERLARVAADFDNWTGRTWLGRAA
ncbi:hypothetical protein [Rhizobium sp. TRM95796]|uniref:hypothetical protein n=1 Tax=Rhizobium sp. TRM95796 TaxID=2979862 RepID=UPI0021E8842F|nr:hypothetical protein [Rhizobium sp. TRM95796]MCV3765588.1 hypothetical protein [Rhizobium sp. TRM95796]